MNIFKKRRSRGRDQNATQISLFSDLSTMKGYQKYSERKERSEKGSLGSTFVSKFESKLKTLIKSDKKVRKEGKEIAIKNPEVPQLNEKQITVREFIEKTLKLISYFYLDNQRDENTIDFNHQFGLKVQSLIKGISFQKNQHKSLNEFFNLIYFQSSNVKYCSFQEIEESIADSWKRNSILYEIRKIWYIQVKKQIQKKGMVKKMKKIIGRNIIKNFKDFLGHLTYISFKNYFSIHEKKHQEQNGDLNEGANWVIYNLSMSTSVYILTQSASWEVLYNTIILPSLNQNQNLKVKQERFDLNFSEKLKDFELYLQKIENPFIITSKNLLQFAKQRKMRVKIQNLYQTRKTLSQEIKFYFQKSIQRKNGVKDSEGKKGNSVDPNLDKDQLISCILLCILKSEQRDELLNQLAQVIFEIQLLLGEDCEQFLGRKKCSSYFTDIEVAFGFIQSEFTVHEEKNEGSRVKSALFQ